MDRQTDKKRCIRAHRVICTGGLKMTGDNCRIGDSKVMTNTKGAPSSWSIQHKKVVFLNALTGTQTLNLLDTVQWYTSQVN